MLIICMAKADPDVHFTIENKVKCGQISFNKSPTNIISMKFIHGSTTIRQYSSRLLTARGKNHVMNQSQNHVNML